MAKSGYLNRHEALIKMVIKILKQPAYGLLHSYRFWIDLAEWVPNVTLSPDLWTKKDENDFVQLSKQGGDLGRYLTAFYMRMPEGSRYHMEMFPPPPSSSSPQPMEVDLPGKELVPGCSAPSAASDQSPPGSSTPTTPPRVNLGVRHSANRVKGSYLSQAMPASLQGGWQVGGQKSPNLYTPPLQETYEDRFPELVVGTPPVQVPVQNVLASQSAQPTATTVRALQTAPPDRSPRIVCGPVTMSPPPAIPGVAPLTTDSEVLKARVLLKTLPYPVHEELTTLTGNQLIEVAK